eukprot:scaffold907_cov144-Skeletonema_menzelii.AAC.7
MLTCIEAHSEEIIYLYRHSHSIFFWADAYAEIKYSTHSASTDYLLIRLNQSVHSFSETNPSIRQMPLPCKSESWCAGV